VTADLIRYFEENQDELGLGISQIYYDFPVLKNLDESIVISKLLLWKNRVIIFGFLTNLLFSISKLGLRNN
jgi:hypothetical protein